MNLECLYKIPMKGPASSAVRLAVRRFFVGLCFAIASLVFGTLRGQDNAEAFSQAELDFFESKVRPILVEHCYECHAGDKSNGGLKLDSRSGWQAGGDSGPAMIPKNIEQSLLIEAVRYGNRDLQMPPSGRMTDEQIQVLEKWISLGIPDPRSNPATIDSKRPMGMSIDEGRKHWAFRPLSEPTIPRIKNESWAVTPVDAFVMEKLEDAGIGPSAIADRRVLLRRLSMDLIGLPPTPEEVRDFLEDKSSDAYEKLVDRLLASPHYGERWGRHWLDVARYADSNGLDENLAFGNAWRYRDYVIRSFNSDKPFNRFLVEQIAGDLLPDANEDTKTATGFLVLGAKVLAEPDKAKLMMDTIDEQIDSTGKAFLGMTLGCVRCHDHKFDPIKQSDYYALAAIFKSTNTFAATKTGAITHWNEHPLSNDLGAEHFEKIKKEIQERSSKATKFKNTVVAKIEANARENAAKYLAVASTISRDDSFRVLEAAALDAGLHPRILFQCRKHLDLNRDDPFCAEWHDLVARSESKESIEAHFKSLFELVASKETSEGLSEENQSRVKFADRALKDKSGFLAVPAQSELVFDPETLREYNQLMEDARLFESQAQDEPSAMGVTDGEVLVSLPIHIRGSHRNLGKPIQRGFPEVMQPTDAEISLPSTQSGRLEFAHWMADASHPLTARVLVNRVWRWHFGRGLVATTDNFGVLGEPPSHPELLDWLTQYFIRSGWSIKSLHRLLLTSNVYRMQSVISHSTSLEANSSKAADYDPVKAEQIDPENRLLWKFPYQRLEAEQVRDAILAVAGLLEKSIGGKSVPLRNRQFVFNHTSVDHTRYDSLRRSVYLPIIRNNLYTLFEQFDFPDPTMPTGSRQSTTVAPQALLMMNNELVLDASESMAARVCGEYSGDIERIRYAYELAFNRDPEDREIEVVRNFVDSVGNPEKAWQLFCQNLITSNEFFFVE